MTSLTLHQLHQRYQELYAKQSQGQFTYEQFIEGAHKLQAQDAAGKWWTIDPTNGSYMTHQNGQWVAAEPSQEVTSRPISQVDLTTSPDIPKPLRGSMGCLSSPLAVGLMSFGAAAFWLIYTSLRSGQEGFDLITPLTIGVLPLLLRFFRTPMNKLLAPVFTLTAKVPRSMRTGAAFGLPVVMGLLFSATSTAGYGGLRLSVILSVIGSYALTRRRGLRG